MLTAADQIALIAVSPSATLANVGQTMSGVGIVDQGGIMVDYRFESAPVMYGDGSVESGKPYAIATSADVEAYAIDHGRVLTIGTVPWYIIGKIQRQDGMYRLTLSRQP